MTFVLRVPIKGLGTRQRKCLLSSIKIRLNDTEEIEFGWLKEDIENGKKKCEFTEKDGWANFVVRDTKDITFKPSLQDFPFDRQEVFLKFELSDIKMKKLQRLNVKKVRPGHHGEEEVNGRCEFRFSFHVHEQDTENLVMKARTSFAANDEVDNMPELDIAHGIERKPKIMVDKGKIWTNVMQLSLPLYRTPEFALFSSFIPLSLLIIVSICTFAVEPTDYAGRLGIITTIVLFAFLPSYRKNLPSAHITVLDWMVLLAMGVLFLVVVDSLLGTMGLHTFTTTYVFAAVSSVAAAGIIAYVVIMYIKYLWNRKSIALSHERHAPKKHATSAFDLSGWENKSIRPPETGDILWKWDGK